ncbi:AAEL011029-PA [Aedes aegypti]|uniref:AAEL011029-PA n=1 Tax=Aedes aegypti TaxID=7159 RepID=Q16R96_AEDAE|nr:AAEL011029-PA [Aedes aegypti]
MHRFIAVLALVAVVQALSIDDRTVDVNINLEKNSNTYFQSKLKEGSFQYGLDVVEPIDHHFQHKVKGPDGVTYGCYGFVDPDGKPHLTHYVSDVKGYRVVPPNSATKIYISRLETSIDNIYKASQEKSVPWKDLFFPPACRTLYDDLVKNAAVTQRPTTARPTTPRSTTPRPTTPRSTIRATTPSTTPAPVSFEPEFGGSNVHESLRPPQCRRSLFPSFR